MAESDNIPTKLQDLLVYLIPQLNKFPRDQKFVMGDGIETKLLAVQEDCLRAYYRRDKRGTLLEANLQLEVARHLVRLANALKSFSNHTYQPVKNAFPVVAAVCDRRILSNQRFGAHRAPLQSSFSTGCYGVLAAKMDEVGRMIGGWLKSVSSVREAPRASV